jgi:FtsP/CotA-like multicopper oxidase with cupredoxin domain
MGDWYHTYASLLVASYLNPTSKWVPNESGVEALADNLILNGKNKYDCSIDSTTFPPYHDRQPKPVCNPDKGSHYVTKVTSEKAYRLRLINHSTFFSFWFSVDNHEIEVVEIDGVEITPIPDRGVNVNIGQRYSIIVRANKTVGNYYMRATFPTTCFLPFVPYSSLGLNSTNFQVMGILSYDDTNPTTTPIGVAGNTSNPSGAYDNPYNYLVWEGCNDMEFDKPKPIRSLPAYPIEPGLNMHYIEFAFRQAQNVNRIFVNQTSWAPLENNATLWKTIGQEFPAGGGASSYSNWHYALNQQVLLLGDDGADKGAQLVVNSLDSMEHPWHLHGHEFQVCLHLILADYLCSSSVFMAKVVGWGKGKYGELPSITTWNLYNPMRRDTISIPAHSHVILRFLADNPGLWVFHCHVSSRIDSLRALSFMLNWLSGCMAHGRRNARPNTGTTN